MRYVGISLADKERLPVDEAGWGEWLSDQEKVAATLDRLSGLVQPGGYGGVFIAAGCGKTLPQYVGRKSNGEDAYTWWAGHTDRDVHPIVGELEARQVPVIVSIGLPRDILGLEHLQVDAARFPSVEIAFDISGANTSLMVPAAMDAVGGNRVRLESRPLPGEEVLEDRHPRYITMASRARKLMERGVEFSGDLIVYNAGRDVNRWNEAEARLHEARDRIVVQPLAFM